jgi:HAD superfamily hydrolase (TIGR01458 family)
MRVKAMLLDLEGVLYEGDRPIEGAPAAVARLRDMGLDLRYLTNTTTRSRAGVAERLAGLGLSLGAETLFTPLAAARRLLVGWEARRIRLAAPEAAAADFGGLELTECGPVDAVVVGDLYKDFDWDLLNDLFGLLRGGAHLIALHKNRYCRRDDGIGLDVGPFVAALEYAAHTRAVVVGKPSPDFFQLALDDMGVTAAEAMMVGDDIDADIGGAQGAGLKAVQVRTGKFTESDLEHPTVRPDFRIDSIATLPELIRNLI